MDFNQFFEAVAESDKQHRIDSMNGLTSQDLAVIITSHLADYRDVAAAKKILERRGVENIPNYVKE